MKKNKKHFGNLDLIDVLMTLLPSLFIAAISIFYFIQLEMHLNMLIFLISPMFITYFVIRSIQLGTPNKWVDWLSISQYAILFLIGFYSVCEYVRRLQLSPVVDAAIILSLTAMILTYVICIVLYAFIYKFERIALSKRLYEKQILISYDIYRELYQLLQEVRNFTSFSYNLTSLPPQEKVAQEKLRQKYRQILSVQKNLLAKKQGLVEANKFYLPKKLQLKLDKLFQIYHQLFSECPTLPEEIKKYEEEIEQLHHNFEDALHQDLGIDFLNKEIQMALKLKK